MKPNYLKMISGMKKGGERDWSVYILRCGDGSLYTGIAKNVDARLKSHQGGKGAAYTRTHLPVTLIYREAQTTRSQALMREAAIKRLSRPQKESLLLGLLLPSKKARKTRKESPVPSVTSAT